MGDMNGFQAPEGTAIVVNLSHDDVARLLRGDRIEVTRSADDDAMSIANIILKMM